MPTSPGQLGDDLMTAVGRLAEVFAARSTRYALVGGIANLLRGRPRFTRDVDVLLDVPQLALPGLLDALTDAGFTLDPAAVIREYVREHMTRFQFGPVRIDWLKPVLPLYGRVLREAGEVPWTTGHPVRVATAEGVVLTKLVAFRPQDQVDIETLLIANQDAFDVNVVREEWAAFAATEPDRTAWLAAALARAGLPPL
jgi:hypothetical protein